MGKVSGRDVVTRMRAIEDNIEGEIGEDSPPLDRVVATLLGLEFDRLDDVLVEEARRVIELIATSYRERGVEMNPISVASLGIVQGVTLAVAAQRMRGEDRDRIAAAIAKLDARGRWLTPARAELQRGLSEDGGWVAQLMADPLKAPVVGWGETPSDAVAALVREVDRIDWRRVRR